MNRLTKRRSYIAAAALSVGLMAASVATPASGFDWDNYDYEAGEYFASPKNVNSADPYVFECAKYGVEGWCMVTSQDLNQAPIDPTVPVYANYYPMDKTLFRFSRDGLIWEAPTTLVGENTLPGVQYNVKHLWAPAARRIATPTQEVRYYIPDLTERRKMSSRIWVARNIGTNPHAQISAFDTQNLSQVTGAPEGIYMSDPDIFSDATNWKTDTSKDYLVWANGDYGSCGTFSMRKLTAWNKVETFQYDSQAKIQVTGFPAAWAKCDQKDQYGNFLGQVAWPYMEGASLYAMDRFATQLPELRPYKYTMVFAVKPYSVPTECQSSWKEPGTSNEAIAYATATNVTGPYTYQGIIMCGSKREWTNQASIMEVESKSKQKRLVLVYHDGVATPSSNTPRQRQIHAECLYTVNGKFIRTKRSEGVVYLNGTKTWCLERDNIVGIKSKMNNRYLSVAANGAITTGSGSVTYAEQFSFSTSATNTEMTINARQGAMYLRANRATGDVLADRTTVGSWEKFTYKCPTFDMCNIIDSEGKYLMVDSSGKLKSGSKTPAGSDMAYKFELEKLTQF